MLTNRWKCSWVVDPSDAFKWSRQHQNILRTGIVLGTCVSSSARKYRTYRYSCENTLCVFLNRALLHASVLNLLVPSFITGRTQSYHTFLFLICTVPHSYQGEPYHRSDLSSVDPSPEKSSLFVALRLECFLTSHVRVRKRFLRPITDPEHPRGVARKIVPILGHSYDLKTVVLQASLLWDTHYPVSGYQDAYHGYLLLPIPHVLCF